MPLKGANFISYLFIQRNRGKRKNNKIQNREFSTVLKEFSTVLKEFSTPLSGIFNGVIMKSQRYIVLL